jgi:hypothetical protein
MQSHRASRSHRKLSGPDPIMIVLSTAMLTTAGFAPLSDPVRADQQPLAIGAYAIEHEIVLPGSPEVIYDAITGDISPWWDHSFSEAPAKFFIEPRPGGGFWEIFDESGDGVLHATVIHAQRGRLLRFDGPLGLSGRAVQMVHTYKFEPAGEDSTRLKVSVHAAGEIDADLAAIVDQVWRHFLFERFGPYVESGRHRQP